MTSASDRQTSISVGRKHPNLLFVAGCSVVFMLLAMWLTSRLPSNTWLYAFMWDRRFVQWVLVFLFLFGLIFTILGWSRLATDRRYSTMQRSRHVPTTGPDTPTRWSRLHRAHSISDHETLSNYLATLRQLDASEIESTYRVPSDVTQLLPLVGFFGTVFGLSIGLYDAFLVKGNISPSAFASAIAIAFDNTLLGLALTIALFVVTNLTRRIDDAIGLEIECAGTALLESRTLSAPDNLQREDLESELKALTQSSRALADVLPKTADGLKKITEAMNDSIAVLAKAIADQKSVSEALAELNKRLDEAFRSQQDLAKDMKEAAKRAASANEEISRELQNTLAGLKARWPGSILGRWFRR